MTATASEIATIKQHFHPHHDEFAHPEVADLRRAEDAAWT
jgi:hypothetical protein